MSWLVEPEPRRVTAVCARCRRTLGLGSLERVEEFKDGVLVGVTFRCGTAMSKSCAAIEQDRARRPFFFRGFRATARRAVDNKEDK